MYLPGTLPGSATVYLANGRGKEAKAEGTQLYSQYYLIPPHTQLAKA